jgi:hypothetical protein
MTTLIEQVTTPNTTLLAEKNRMLKPPVTILDDYGRVDKELVHISKGNKEQVDWINNAPHDVTIVFNESPFDGYSFSVPAHGKAVSGWPKASHGPKSYKYTVVGFLGNNDPGVIIDR